MGQSYLRQLVGLEFNALTSTINMWVISEVVLTTVNRHTGWHTNQPHRSKHLKVSKQQQRP